MNEQDQSADALERHQDIEPVEPDFSSEAAKEEPNGHLNEDVGPTGLAQAGERDESPPAAQQQESGHAESESPAAAVEGTTEDAGLPVATEPVGGNAEDGTPEKPHDQKSADLPSADSAGEGQPGPEPESQIRRVLLQAGTDEESLKALALCREKVTQLHLRMHPLAARWESDRHVIIFFRADDKVDFRKLVRELSRLLHARIELRQVGPREQGKLCGLVGKCGYPLCCQTFLGQFAQSTIKMAKTQELALNPMKISGVCGRLLCCLNYEQEMYLDAKSRMPRVNRMVQTEFGPGRVVAVNVLKETVTVQLETMTKELRPNEVQLAEGQS
jgi:cell fate regulator YaaT (PSP1 superfamily)